jgi:hypothetical protein
MPAENRTRYEINSRKLRGDAETDAAPPHFGKAHRASTAAGSVVEMRFALANFGDRGGEIAIPFDGVQREIEVGVEDEHF